jgi:serine/threonine protein kinase
MSSNQNRGDRVNIQPGQTLLHYRLTEKIGEGGMGAVWRATDTTLDREVAIKILPEAFATDPARLARFEREAKLLASLNHPNIAAVHGLHAHNDVHFLAMELVEGEDLSARLRRGALPIEESLKVGAQVAEALEAAHAQGVIHRDLKPANIILMSGARAKVLDFGLAKALAGEPGSSADPQNSPTITSLGSVAGVLLGTAAYMSPEQARGKELDKRSDIWSFGCVLYECLVGRPLFAGETVTDVLSSVLQREPDWDALPDQTPPRVRDLLERCLERSLRDRLHDIADARIVLERSVATREWTISGIASAPVLPAMRRGAGLSRWALLAAGLVIGAGVALLLGRGLSPAQRELPLRKFQLADQGSGVSRPEISPDGSRIAYIKDSRLWIRNLDRIESRELAGSEGTSLHTWSPDGNWLAISKESKLWKLPASGGEPILLAALPESLSVSKAGGLTWGSNGQIGYNVGDAGLMAVPEQGGTPTSLLEPGEGEQDFHHIRALPDGRGYLFAVHTDDAMDTLSVLTDDGREDIIRIPGQDLGMPVYSPSGHLLFWRRPDNAGIWAVSFSLQDLEVTDEPFPVTAMAGSRYNVSRDGTLVFVRPAPPRTTRLVVVDRQGLVLRPIGEPQLNQELPALSPNGQRVAVAAGDENPDVWIHEMESGAQMRLTFDDAPEFAAAWLPSGDRIGFVRAGVLAGEIEMYVTASDGSGETMLLGVGNLPDFSPDGRFAAFSAPDEQLDEDIWYAPLDEGGQAGEPVELLETDGDLDVDFSPDGRLLVYASDDSGRSEIYITRFPGGDGKWQVSKNGGTHPCWSPKGDRIYFAQGQDLMQVPVVAGASPRLSQPSKLFTWAAIGRGFDVTRDGQQFVMIEEADPGAAGPQITVVQNWAAEFSKN